MHKFLFAAKSFMTVASCYSFFMISVIAEESTDYPSAILEDEAEARTFVQAHHGMNKQWNFNTFEITVTVPGNKGKTALSYSAFPERLKLLNSLGTIFPNLKDEIETIIISYENHPFCTIEEACISAERSGIPTRTNPKYFLSPINAA